jgi:uncharacterized membrane protein
MFWLSHHRDDELHRTYDFFGVRVCARCLGTYPILFAALAVQVRARAPLAWRFDLPWALLLPLPALVDWAYGRFRPHAGNNALRSGTGVLLGLGLGRTLYVHFLSPWPAGLIAQVALVTAVALPVILLSYKSSRG